MDIVTIGNFYFCITADGHLIGEYFNQSNGGMGTEIAQRELPGVGYLGAFRSTWWQGEKEYQSDLKISGPKKDGRFILEWNPRDTDKSGKFYGEGVVRDGKLIGFYRNN